MEIRPGPSHIDVGEQPPWQAEYVEKLLQRNMIESATHSALPTDLLIKGSKQLLPNSHFSKSVRKGIQVLEREHNITASWAPESVEFNAGLLALVHHKVRQGQLAVERHVRDISLVQLLHKHVYTRRTETRNLTTVRNVRMCAAGICRRCGNASRCSAPSFVSWRSCVHEKPPL